MTGIKDRLEELEDLTESLYRKYDKAKEERRNEILTMMAK